MKNIITGRDSVWHAHNCFGALKRYAVPEFKENEYKIQPCAATGKYFVCMGRKLEPLFDHLFSNRFVCIKYATDRDSYVRKYWTTEQGEPVAITLREKV